MRQTLVAGIALGALSVLQIGTVAEAGQFIPFHGTLEASVTHADGGPGIDLVTLTGSGQATQLGQFSFSAPHAVDLATQKGPMNSQRRMETRSLPRSLALPCRLALSE